MAPRKTDSLIPLQELDLQIHGLRVQASEKPRQLADVEGKLAHAKKNLEAVQAEIKALKLEGAKRELTVKEFDDKIAKITTQSMTARKNDEYQAFQKEISGLKADKTRVEDGLLDIMMQVEEKVKLEKLRQEELKQAEAGHAAEKKRIEAEVATVNREIEGVLSTRASLQTGIEKEILRVYERVLVAKDDGLALSPVAKYEMIEDEGKVIYWQCGGCGVGLNMQDVNLLMMGKEIQFCRTCSRIMYLKQEPLVPKDVPKPL
jgi:predicted  nucleic acid-binding Zn-ribbon protein